MRFARVFAVASLPLVLLVGCHSAWVQARVVNRTGATLSLIEVDYPSASFGTQNLGDGAEFRYRFKVLGTGAMKLTYVDRGRKEHTSQGPVLREGAEGGLEILIAPAGVQWTPTFRP